MSKPTFQTNLLESFGCVLEPKREVEIFSMFGSGEEELRNQLIANLVVFNPQCKVHIIQIDGRNFCKNVIERVSVLEKRFLTECIKRIFISECSTKSEIMGALKLTEWCTVDSVVIISSINLAVKKVICEGSLDWLYQEIHVVAQKIPVVYFRSQTPTKAEKVYWKNKLLGFYSTMDSTIACSAFENTRRIIVSSLLIDGKMKQIIGDKESKKVKPFVVSNTTCNIVD
ncbi:hypothetical protein EIN_470220 [Entamoeba invadens IP1]|uniref:Uncharacterized protein n=1 Tax=Entamoeba invadens IP1 TaxID=370355 RepID=A0A0A1TWP7_ENTIV|nr:hypothetical protein EIN_470220 [Entamoeba invadens IP1]ELP83778.1 hypothetical protein EIN_470220 [Entamoeba invadens IP1]|eukprot:XP_004183124.1 hypothetical protein EIN_470220 [Entamoeba invadens IP1]